MKQLVTEERLNAIIRESIQEALEEDFINVGDGARWLGRQFGRLSKGWNNVKQQFNNGYNTGNPQQPAAGTQQTTDDTQNTANTGPSQSANTAANGGQNTYPTPENGFQGQVGGNTNNPGTTQAGGQTAQNQAGNQNQNGNQNQKINNEIKRGNRILQKGVNGATNKQDAAFIARAIKYYMTNMQQQQGNAS